LDGWDWSDGWSDGMIPFHHPPHHNLLSTPEK
jgi:hypothetical protein